MRFIAEHKDRTDGGLRWGVESICRVLSEHGAAIAPSTYYEAASRPPSKRALRDDALRAEIARVHETNYGVYGPRKVWLALNREGIPVARCTVERLMRDLGMAGARRGKRVTTTRPALTITARPADLVQRWFRPPAPNRLWVADFTYVSTWSGMVYVAFVIDAYARRILGWRASTSMHRLGARHDRAGDLDPAAGGCHRPRRADASPRQRVARWIQLVVATPHDGGVVWEGDLGG